MGSYRLDIEPLPLGPDVRAIGLELTDAERGEPAQGQPAAHIWSRVLAALPGTEPWALDFFSHLHRVREYCRAHGIAYREAASRTLVVDAPVQEAVENLLARFADELFGARAGERLRAGDPALEAELSRRGADAYHAAFPNYFFCALCDFGNGTLTLLTDHLWPAEVLRRVRPAVKDLAVEAVAPGFAGPGG
ncbi:MAG: hypothetical protein K6U02_00090 [Firmicutes bacterium]|nr:hypothetical protein [Bacillota bacterium]